MKTPSHNLRLFCYVFFIVPAIVSTSSFACKKEVQNSSSIEPLLVEYLEEIGGTSLEGNDVKVKTGRWGGQGILLEVKKDSASVDMDCATAAIPVPLRTKSDGRFELTGSLIRRSFGPIIVNSMPKPQAVKFIGKITRKQMNLRITYLETGEVIGQFSLEYGKTVEMTRCY